MEFLVDALTGYGYWGMLLAAFLAGSFIPFSSEAVMIGLTAAGLNPALLIAYGTAGNVGGSLLNYFVGRMGKTEWIERYLHVTDKNMQKAQKFLAGHGAWMGFFAFVPILGNAITITLGLMRANFLVTLTSITAGKVARYLLLLVGMSLIF